MTDEEWEIVKQDAQDIPPDTCPLIDEVVDALHNIGKCVLRADRAYESVGEMAKDIDSELWGKEDLMEKIRDANDMLRGLSHYWYKIAKQLNQEVEAKHDRLREALQQYGRHPYTCGYWHGQYQDEERCTCGLCDVLYYERRVDNAT